MTFSEFFQMLTALIAIVNPISAIPLYLAFTENTQDDRPMLARQAAIGVTVILVVSLFVGHSILSLFGITMDSFRIAGGLLLLFMGFNMINAHVGRTRHTKAEDEEAIEREAIGIVPLAIPLLAGPGAISTVILYSDQVNGYWGNGLLVTACLLVGLIVWVGLRLGPAISDRVGTTGMNIFTRIMGLILSAIAVEFILGGIMHALPGLLS